jgi:hypothetical protein
MVFYCPCGQPFDGPTQPCLLCHHYPSVYVESVVVRDARSFHAMNDNRETHPSYSLGSPHSTNPPHSPNSIRSPHSPHSPLPHSRATTGPTVMNHEDTRVPNRSFSTMTAVKKNKSGGSKLRTILKALLKFRTKKPHPVAEPQVPTTRRMFSFDEPLVRYNTEPVRRNSPPVGLVELPATQDPKAFELWAPTY